MFYIVVILFCISRYVILFDLNEGIYWLDLKIVNYLIG